MEPASLPLIISLFILFAFILIMGAFKHLDKKLDKILKHLSVDEKKEDS
jgi:hypothetical protein